MCILYNRRIKIILICLIEYKLVCLIKKKKKNEIYGVQCTVLCTMLFCTQLKYLDKKQYC